MMQQPFEFDYGSHPDFSESEWKTRVDLAALFRLVVIRGWDDLFGTHLSARLPDNPNHILLNPLGYQFQQITASSLIRMDEKGNKVTNTPLFPIPAGFVIHSAIQGGRNDINWCMHLHTLDGMAVGINRDGLLPLTQLAMMVVDDLAYHGHEGVADDDDEGPRLVADLGNKNSMLLRNHGSLTVGESAVQAFMRMYFLEQSCTAQVRALSSAQAVHHAAPEVVEKTFKQGEQMMKTLMPIAGPIMWSSLLHEVESLDPSFKS